MVGEDLKFAAALRILTEQLSPSAGAFLVDGGELRYEVWDENKVALEWRWNLFSSNSGRWAIIIQLILYGLKERRENNYSVCAVGRAGVDRLVH